MASEMGGTSLTANRITSNGPTGLTGTRTLENADALGHKRSALNDLNQDFDKILKNCNLCRFLFRSA